jgi:peptidoglycan hydrolase CwlO-like protein
MKINGKNLVFFLIPIVTFLLFARSIQAQNCDSSCPSGDMGCVTSRIADCTSKISTLQSQANTLSNQIAQFNAQIELTTLKIDQTKEQIVLLGGRIDQLEVSLDSLTEAFSSRAVETYKMARLGDPVFFLLSAPDLSEAVSRFHYLERIQESDRGLLQRLQTAQTTYQGQKADQEELQKQLVKQQSDLNSQKAAKATLLAATKNDEKKYQQLLAQARAEYEAIQGIIAGRGQETEVGKVNQGDKIASIIQGSSCNSSGSHVHFIISQGGSTQNPFNYLKGADYENCSGSSCNSGDGDPFSPSGSWDWPISPRIEFAQGYGSTWAIRYSWVGKIYQFHNGIDVNSQSSSDVRAVKGGTLYRGGIGGSGCTLRYVRVKHDEGGLDTYYLHVNY